MPFVDNDRRKVSNPFAVQEQPRDDVGFFDVLPAAFRQENDVNAMLKLADMPAFEEDITFNVAKAMEDSPLKSDYFEQLARATSQAEFDYITQDLWQQINDRQLMGAAGGWGFTAGMAAGTLSPTMAIPLMGPAKGVKGVAQAIALAGVAATAQEGALFLTQSLRTKEEALFGIGAGTILGGMLGSAGVYLKGRVRARVEADMALIRGEETISPAAPPSSREAVPEPEYSPPYKLNTAVPHINPKTTVGDDVIVFNEKGETTIARVTAREGRQTTVALETGEEIILGKGLTQHNPRSATYELKTGAPKDRVKTKDLGARRMVNELERLETELKKLAAQDPSTLRTAMQQDFVALLVEAARRRDAAVKPDVVGPPKPLTKIGQKLDEAARRADALPIQRRPTEGDLPVTSRPVAEEPAVRAPDDVAAPKAPEAAGAAAAPSTARPSRHLERKGPVSGWLNDQLAKLNPVTRVTNQHVSNVASFWMAKLHDAGLMLAGNLDGIAHAVGGTVTSRAAVHQKALAKFIRQFDDAYSRHVFGDKKPDDRMQKAFWAQMRAGTGTLPEGKLSPKEFAELVFDLSNNGETYADTHVMAAVKSQLDTYEYFRKIAVEAHQYQLTQNPDARPMFDTDAALGKDIANYIHHVYDSVEISRNPTVFMDQIRANAIQNAQADWKQAFGSFSRKQDLRRTRLELLKLSKEERNIKLDEIEAEKVAAEARPDTAAYLAGRKDLMDERTAARKAVREAAAAEPTGEGLTARELEEATDEWHQATLDAADDLERAELSLKDWEDNPSIGVKDDLDYIKKLNRDKREIKNTPDGTQARIRKAENAIERQDEIFEEKWRTGRGATDISLRAGTANFEEHGDEIALAMFNNITGLGSRVSGMDILAGARGPELIRSLNLPYAQKKRWLHTDPEFVMRRYIRQLSSDVELYRATGSVNGARMFDEVKADFDTLRLRIDAAKYEAKIDGVWQPADADAKGARELTDARRQKLQDQLKKSQESISADMEVAVQRLRHQRGLPENPSGLMYRFGQAALNVNVVRSMGTVVPSSLPDIARPVMKYGLLNTLRHGWVPFLTDLSRVKATRAEAREMGIALDTILHNRSQAVFDMVADTGGRQSIVEKALTFLANKTGLVAGFDAWTAEMKLISTAVGNGVFSKAIREINEGGASVKQIAKSKKLLANAGIDEDMAKRIWAQYNKEGGSTTFDGNVKLPNTQAWDDYDAVSALGAAFNKWADDTIVTPSLDRPNWVDQNMMGRILAQFRSFTFTSTNRVLMSGLQQQDMALMNGVTISLALGAVSAYIWAISIGGETAEEMLEWTPEKWADEAISRSGLLGVFTEVQEIASKVPYMAPYATFAGEPPSNRQARGVMGAIAGPTYSLAEKVINVGMGFTEPTQSTVHQMRTLTPYQNVFYLRQLYTMLEEQAVEDLPKRRTR